MIRPPPKATRTHPLWPYTTLFRSNREEDAPGVLPVASDGHAVPGNALDDDAREARLARFFRPYHDHIAATIAAHRPAMILSLHSFTPSLAAHPDQARPWHVGVLYNEADRLAAAAIAADRKSVV